MKKIDWKKAEAKFSKKLGKLRMKAHNQHKMTIGALARRGLHGKRPDTKTLSEIAAAIASKGKHDAEESVRRALDIWLEADFVLHYAASHEEKMKEYAPPPGVGPLPLKEFLKLYVEGGRTETREKRFFDYKLHGRRGWDERNAEASAERWRKRGKEQPISRAPSSEESASASIERYRENGIARKEIARMAMEFDEWWKAEKSRRLKERAQKGGEATAKAKKKRSHRK